ncbi:MAG: Crp/Fnr family transcriptional regulator [Bacteroidia bacterium]
MALSAKHISLLKQRYGVLLEEALLDEIINTGTVLSVPRDNIVIDIGDTVDILPLVLDGSIKIMREDKEHQELLLYYLEFGDTCAMTLNCCMKQTKSPIRATAEQDTLLLIVPVANMEVWMGRYPSWRAYILESYNIRLNEMLESIDTLAFMNMEERLLKYLHDKALINQTTELEVTHQAIAEDLHTSRVVVSRVLKKLEKEGAFVLKRNRIVLDLSKL